MKLICTQENLKTGLSLVGRIISSSNTLPILNNILLKTENGSLKISSTNLEVAIVTNIRCKIEEDGEVTVAAKTITDLIGNMPNKNITLLTSGSELKIDTESYHTSINTLPAEDFPLIPVVESGGSVEIDAQELKTSIDQVVFAASTNQTQPEISGVYFSLEGDNLKIVATDRYRLAEKSLVLKSKSSVQESVIIPHKTILELSRIIGSQKGQVGIVLNQTQVSMSFNDTQIISRLVDGQYPDYKQIIPTSFTTAAVTEKQGLVSALRAASIFSQGANSVKFEILADKNLVVLTSESSGLGKSVVELPSKVDGAGGSMVFNHRYVLDCLSGIQTSEVVIKVIDDSSPGLIVPEGENDYIYLIMPIKS